MALSNLFRQHWGAFATAFLVGLVCVMPYLYFALATPQYAGIAMVGSSDEEHYVARIAQVYSGHASLGNVFLPNKEVPPVQPGLGENIVARLGMLFGLEAPAINVVSKFLFPAAVALLVYVLAFVLFASRSIAIISSFFVLFGDNLISGVSSITGLFLRRASTAEFLSFDRPIHPEVNALFLFGTLYLFYQAFIKRTEQRFYEILFLGVLIGLSLYVSPYIVTFLSLLCALWCMWRLYQGAYKAAFNIIYAGVVTLVVSIPFLLNYRALMGDALYHEAASRFGLIASHTPVFSVWIFAMLGCAIFLWPRAYHQAQTFFILSGVTLLFLTEQQFLSGYAVQLSHYHWYITKPLIGIMLSMYAVTLIRLSVRQNVLRMFLYMLLLGVLLYNALLIQVHSYQVNQAVALSAQAYAPVLSYLKMLPHEEVVWTDRTLSLYVSMYTKHNAPNNVNAPAYLVSNTYLVDRMLLEYRLKGVQPSEILTELTKDRADVSARIFQLYWREQAGDYKAIPDALLREYASQYQEVYTKSYQQLLKELGITMLVWDTHAEPTWPIDSFSFVRKVFTDGNIMVYVLD